jgi:hypothetical protein
MGIIQGIHKTTYKSLLPLLRQWIKHNKMLYETWRADDCPWRYNERALLSVLAGAAWRLPNGLAYEEFSNSKRKRGRRKGTYKSYSGRSDIYLVVGGQEYVAEAKHCFSGATAKRANITSRLDAQLKQARKEIRASAAPNQRRLAILFAIPYVRSKQRSEVADLVDCWLTKIKEEVEYSYLAWFFAFEPYTHQVGKWIYPGIAVLIREVSRRSR